MLTPFRREQNSILRGLYESVLRLLGVSAGSPLTARQRASLVKSLTDLTNKARTSAADNAWKQYLADRPGGLEDLARPLLNALPESYTAEVLATYLDDLESPIGYVGAAGRIAQSQARMVENAARDQTIAAVRVDPAAETWARVPVGETCGWCLMLCSRGAVYATKSSASKAKKRAGKPDDRFHLNCNCAVVPVFRGRRYEGQDHNEALAELWNDVTKGRSGQAAVKAFDRAVQGGDADHAKDARKKVGSRRTDDTRDDKAPRLAQLNAQITALEKSSAALRDSGSNPDALAWQENQLKRLRKERSELR